MSALRSSDGGAVKTEDRSADCALGEKPGRARRSMRPNERPMRADGAVDETRDNRQIS